MKRIIAMVLAAFAAAGAAAQTNVGVSVEVVQPGVYGRIDIGRFPRPEVVYAKPVIITPAPVAVQPVYLYVPPGHQKNWAKHCARYNACGQPVYFVKESWVEAEHAKHGKKDKKHKGKGKDKD
ncbi:MAG TPA: hypothetical protein VF169_13915 [Albitalea sp.]|uniref:hypothetical protein n=1 Tax=Piscinibacter sp. TaxID=1903157 RepID=UPI002ED1B44B